jgi:hypothetical protein
MSETLESSSNPEEMVDEGVASPPASLYRVSTSGEGDKSSEESIIDGVSVDKVDQALEAIGSSCL